jgi:hypothetical protein
LEKGTSYSPVTSSLFGPNILLSTLFSNTLSLRFSFSIRDQDSHPYKTKSKIIILYVLIYTYLDSRRGDRKFWTEKPFTDVHYAQAYTNLLSK